MRNEEQQEDYLMGIEKHQEEPQKLREDKGLEDGLFCGFESCSGNTTIYNDRHGKLTFT